jgi:hypothetical protein
MKQEVRVNMKKPLAVLCAAMMLLAFSPDAFAKAKKGDVYVEGDARKSNVKIRQPTQRDSIASRVKATKENKNKGTIIQTRW